MKLTAFCLGICLAAPAAEAATVSGQSYTGSFGSPAFGGAFVAVDANGDGNIETSELVSFAFAEDNSFAGMGQSAHTSNQASDFLYRSLPTGGGVVSGMVTFVYDTWYCGGDSQLPCDVYSALYPGSALYEQRWLERSFAGLDGVMTPAPVPLPAGGALIAGALAALTALRRRRSS